MKITINDPRLPKGQEIALTGLNGILVNGESVDIDEDSVKLFEKRTGKKLSDVVKGNKFGGTPHHSTKATKESEDKTEEKE